MKILAVVANPVVANFLLLSRISKLFVAAQVDARSVKTSRPHAPGR
jgi:hypothetical protein